MERVGMPPSQRIAATAASSGFAGFVIGFYRSSRAAGLQYLAENTHSLPRNLPGWYFYHKTKNYRIAYGGIKGGVKLGTRVGIWSALYGVIEATVDYSINRTGLVGSVSAGAMTAAIFASYCIFCC